MTKDKKTEIITFRTTPTIKKEIEKEAQKKKWSTAQLTEEILKDYMKKHKIEEL